MYTYHLMVLPSRNHEKLLLFKYQLNVDGIQDPGCVVTMVTACCLGFSHHCTGMFSTFSSLCDSEDCDCSLLYRLSLAPCRSPVG